MHTSLRSRSTTMWTVSRRSCRSTGNLSQHEKPLSLGSEIALEEQWKEKQIAFAIGTAICAVPNQYTYRGMYLLRMNGQSSCAYEAPRHGTLKMEVQMHMLENRQRGKLRDSTAHQGADSAPPPTPPVTATAHIAFQPAGF